MSAFRRTVLLASSLAVSAGCALPHLTPQATGKAGYRGPVGLFATIDGSARVSIRVIDDRPKRAVQDLADADDYDAVLFKLTNSSKLKNTLTSAVKPTNGVYQAAFEKLPSDTGTNYVLTAGLFRDVVGENDETVDKTSTAFSEVDNKVGEGASTAFSLAPGESKQITIHINAVGDLSFESSFSVLDEATPVFRSGDDSITLDTEIVASENPEATGFAIHIVDMNGATASSEVVARANWPATDSATVSLDVPTLESGTSSAYKIIVDLLKNSTVLSRRQRIVTVEANASVGVEFKDPTPAPQNPCLSDCEG